MTPAFGFASPWLLLGLGLAAVPIVIHLLFRRPQREVRWAATRFLLAAAKKQAARLRIEQLVLLASRVAAVAFVVLALSRPYLADAPSAAGPVPPVHRVLVIDVSYSMGQGVGGTSRLDRAKAAAREVIDAARPGDTFQLVRMSDLGPRIAIARPARQPSQVAEAVAESDVTAGRADPVAALGDVFDLLRRGPDLPEREVLVFSDFQRADWQPPGARAAELRRLLAEIGKRATIRLFDAGGPEAGNVGLTDLVAETDSALVGEPIRLVATVRRHDGPADPVRVELHVDGRLTATETVRPSAGENATVAFRDTFAEPGPHAVEVRLSGDAVAADDRRFLAVTARDRFRVLLVDGAAAGRPEQASTFYLRRALAPGGTETAAPTGGEFEPVVVTDGDLAGRDLAGFDVVALANVGLVTDREAARLRAFVASGGGLLIALGDRVRPEAYNRLFADAGENALLPVRLTDRVGDPVRPEEAVLFDATGLEHPIVRPFAGNPGAGLDTDFVLAYAKAEPTAEAAAVPLRFDTGDPAIVAAPLGTGRVVLLTTSVDTTWAGPWPQAGPSFLPLMHEAVRYAATGRPAGRSVRVGEPLVWTVPQRVAGLTAEVRTPAGVESAPTVVGSDGLTVALDATERPGFYRFELGPPVNRAELYAANVDAAEGDMSSLSPAEQAALTPSARILVPGVAGGDAAAPPDWTLSRWLLAAALGLLLAEPVLAWRFGWGLLALGGVLSLLLFRAAWLIDPYLGTAVGLFGLAAVAAGAVVRRRRL